MKQLRHLVLNIGVAGQVHADLGCPDRREDLLGFPSILRPLTKLMASQPVEDSSRLHTSVITKLHLQMAVDSDLIGQWSAKHDFNSVNLPKKRKTFSCVITSKQPWVEALAEHLETVPYLNRRLRVVFDKWDFDKEKTSS